MKDKEKQHFMESLKEANRKLSIFYDRERKWNFFEVLPQHLSLMDAQKVWEAAEVFYGNEREELMDAMGDQY